MSGIRIWKRSATLQLPAGYVGDELRYALQPRALQPGNRVTLLRGGTEAYAAMLAAIRSARDSVHLEVYTLKADHVGQRFAQTLAERAQANVSVRLLYDSAGSLALPAQFVEDLLGAGVEVVEYAPVAPWRRRFGLDRLQRRDHRKILVCDGQVGFTGGLNIASEYAPPDGGGDGWHDVHARIEGPAVAELSRLFRRSWLRGGGQPYPLVEPPAAESVAGPGTALVWTLGNEEYRRRFGIRRAYLHAIKRSRRSIGIMNAYFIPDPGIRRALGNAAKRGVAVRIIVPATSDVPAVRWASRHLYARLMRAGVRLFEWPAQMMHAKMAVVDGLWTAVGSANLDNRSLLYNLEVVAVVLDSAFGETSEQQFEADLARCREITARPFAARPWWHRVVEWFFYQFRRWL